MSRNWNGWMIAMTAGFVLALGGYGYGAGTSTTTTKTTTPAPVKPTYIVVEVMDVKGVVTYEGIQVQNLKTRVTQAHQLYVKALETWKKNKALAAINKTKFDEPTPVRGYVRRVQTTPASFKYPELARAEAIQVAKQKQLGKPPVTTTETPEATTSSKPHEPPTGEVVKPAETDDAEGAAIAQKTCPVTGQPVNKDVFLDYQGRKVYFCCPDCKPTFNKDPEKYLKIVDDQLKAAQTAPADGK